MLSSPNSLGQNHADPTISIGDCWDKQLIWGQIAGIPNISGYSMYTILGTPGTVAGWWLRTHFKISCNRITWNVFSLSWDNRQKIWSPGHCLWLSRIEQVRPPLPKTKPESTLTISLLQHLSLSLHSTMLSIWQPCNRQSNMNLWRAHYCWTDPSCTSLWNHTATPWPNLCLIEPPVRPISPDFLVAFLRVINFIHRAQNASQVVKA